MKLYIIDKETLEIKRVGLKYILIFIASVSFVSIMTILIFANHYSNLADSEISQGRIVDIESLEDEERIIVIGEGDSFTEQKLVDMLLELNVKFPDIVFAQAMYESARWESNIWEENNNMFGMKVARVRPTTNLGAQYGHALYKNWRMSVYDYALWQAHMTKGLKTRSAYMAYLKKVYAEGTYHAINTLTKEAITKYPELYVKTWPFLER